jgi:hypothetical protein
MQLRHSRLSISVHGTWLPARLAHSPAVRGLVLLPRTHVDAGDVFEQTTADALQLADFATLAFDLLRDDEMRDADARFNVNLLAERLLAAIEWTLFQPGLLSLPLGIVATDTASAAAIRAASHMPGRVGALALLAGRPDLAGAAPLRALKAPVCFVVGMDNPRGDILRQAFDLTGKPHSWRDTPGGEPDKQTHAQLASGAEIATDWMLMHLPLAVAEEGAVFSTLAAALSYSNKRFQSTREQ